MNSLKTTLLTLVAVAAAAPAVAQAPVSLTLDDAVARALATSHRLGELTARQQGAEATVEGRRAAQLPQLSAQAGYTRTNHVDEFGIAMPGTNVVRVIYPDIPDNFRTRLDMQWPIYTFGRLDALERAAKAEAGATAQDLAAARNDLRLEVTRAFWAVVTGTESVRVVDESVKRMDASLADMRNRLAVGLIPPNDVLSMEAQRSRQQMLLVQARNIREQALTDVRRLTGLAPDAEVRIEAALAAAPLPVSAADQMVQNALASRPERKAIQARLTGAGDRRDAAAADRKPLLGVGAGFDYASPNTRLFPRSSDWKTSWDVSVNLSWTFYDFGRVKAAVAAAAADERAARERLAQFDEAVGQEVRQRRLDLESAKAAVGAAEDAVRAATEARRVVENRYASGVATSTDVLDAQVALLQAGLDRTQALASVRLAEAMLERAMGR